MKIKSKRSFKIWKIKIKK